MKEEPDSFEMLFESNWLPFRLIRDSLDFGEDLEKLNTFEA